MDNEQLTKAFAALVAALDPAGRSDHKGPAGSAADIASAIAPVLPLIGQLLSQGLPALATDHLLQAAAHNKIWFGGDNADVFGGWLLSDRPAPGHLLPERFQVPDQAIELSAPQIDQLMRQLLPPVQIRQILPHIWSGCALGAYSLDQHVAELVQFAASDADAARALLKGDLQTAEPQLLEHHARCLLRRHMVIWILADVVRTARLIAAFNDAARAGITLTDVALSRPRSDTGTLNLGALLGSSQDILNALISLPSWPEDGNPAHCPNQLAHGLKTELESHKAVKEFASEFGDGLPDFRNQLRSMLPGLVSMSTRIEGARKRDPAEHPSMEESQDVQPGILAIELPTGSANKSAFESFVGVAPTVGVLIVALRAAQALGLLKRSATAHDGSVCSQLVELPWTAIPRFPTYMKLVVHICRMKYLKRDEEIPSEYNAGTRLVDWERCDFSLVENYREALTEIDTRKMLQDATRQAKASIADSHGGATQGSGPSEPIRKWLDLSFRHRS